MSNTELKLIRIDVTQEDIDDMNSRYDSGMADRTTANAISLALRKKLRPENIPQIALAARHRACRLHIGPDWFPLPQKIYGWLDGSNRGMPVSPESFCITLPENLLIP